MEIKLQPIALTQAAFAEFGEVVALDNAKNQFSMNDGMLERFYDLASIAIGADNGGRPVISIAQANQATQLPLDINMMERHPLASQLIYPLFSDAMIVVAAPKGAEISPDMIRAFYTTGTQGINYFANTWHLPIIALHAAESFLIVDRGGPEKNCDEFYFNEQTRIRLLPIE
jgi:ureidoglycolate lyase